MLSFFLLTLLCTSQAIVTIIDSSCDSAPCQDYLMTYVKRMNSEITCARGRGPNGDEDLFISTISHTKPYTGTIAGLYARAFTNAATTIEVTGERFYRTDDSSKMYLHVALDGNQIQDSTRCIHVATNQTHIFRECHFTLSYHSAVQGYEVQIHTYKMGLIIPRTISGNFVVVGNPILKDGCDCNLRADLKYTAKMYRGLDCNIAISAGASLVYGDYVCIEIIGEDTITKSANFKVNTLTSTYSRQGRDDQTIDMRSVAIIACNSANTCEKGRIRIIMPIMSIGRLNFAVVIVLEENLRLLASGDSTDELPTGFQADLPGEFDVEDDGTFTEDDIKVDIPKGENESGSSNLVVSLITILASLLLVL